MKAVRLKNVFGGAMAIVATGLVLFMVADTFGLLPESSSASTASPALATSPVPTSSLEATIGVEPDQSDDFIVASSGKKCRQLRVMPLGDSLTSFPDSYRGPLFRALFTQNINVDFVGSMREKPAGGGDADHEGHGGFTIGPDSTGNLFDNVETWLNEARPDVIILTIGTNDLAQRNELQVAAPRKFAELITNIQKIAPLAVLVLNDLPPTATYRRGFAPQVALDATAKRLGSQYSDDLVLYAATRNAFDRLGYNPKVDIRPDKIHLTVAGGKKFALALLPTVREAIVLAEKRRAC